MDDDAFPFGQPGHDRTRQRDRLGGRCRNRPVADWKRHELHAPPPAQLGLVAQAELRYFIPLQQADDDVDSLAPPSGDLVLEPIAGPRPGRNRQSPGAGAISKVT